MSSAKPGSARRPTRADNLFKSPQGFAHSRPLYAEFSTQAFQENIAQVEKYFSDVGIDTSALEAPERVYSALDWTSAGIEGPDAVEAQVRKYEADVLDAYDRAIEPYAAGDAELQFLTQQYEALSEKLGGLTPDRAAA